MDNIFMREEYLNKIRGFYHSDIIKVVTGIRRCGKSYFLLSVIKDLKNNGIPENNIININLDKRGFKNIKTADKLEEVIDRYITDDEKKYIFIDEIQNVKGFEEVINAYREDGHSIFITGSNSYLLSGELMTKLTGRYVEIEVYYAGVPTSEQLNLNDRYDKSNQPYTPDAVIIAYESIPKNGVHEFWQVDSKDSSDHVKYLERDKYNIKHTLSSEEAAKYQDVRDGIAFRQQVRSGVFPKNLLELATKCKENDDSKPNGRSVSKIGPSV